MLINKLFSDIIYPPYGLSRIAIICRIMRISKHPVGPYQLRYLRRMHVVNNMSDMGQLFFYTHISIFPINRFYKQVHKFKRDVLINTFTNLILVSINIGAMFIGGNIIIHLACIVLTLLMFNWSYYIRLKHLSIIFRYSFNNVGLSIIPRLNGADVTSKDVMQVINEIRRTIGNRYPTLGKSIDINRAGYTDGIVVDMDRSKGTLLLQIRDPVHPGITGQMIRIEIDYLETLEFQGAHGLL